MANMIKRHFYNGKHYILNKEDKVVRLLPEFFEQLQNKKLWGKFGFKKIGGSSIGDVLKVDKWKSEFAAFCRMAWIGLPILDRKYVDAGIAIEPMVVKLIENRLKTQVQTFDPYQYNFDFFSDKDDVVGGIPDGYIEKAKIIIEIKTTGEKNASKWTQWGVPPAYLKQAQLYAYLMGANEFSIVATFLKDQDYINPQKYDITKRQTGSWHYKLDKSQAEDDIKIVKKWYEKYTTEGISPTYDEDLDADLIKWLEVKNEHQWEQLKQHWISEGKLVL